jgi:hypothetical protein
MAPTDPDPDRLSWWELLWLALLTAILCFLILYFGGIGLRAYHGVRFDSALPFGPGWWDLLLRFSFGVAVALGTLTLVWRLIYRKRGQAHWGTALLVIGVLLFGFLVWPTPWTYPQFGCTVFQINRLVGHYKEVTKVPMCEQALGAAQSGG